MILKHHHVVLNRNFLSINPSVSWAMGYLIATNLGDLVFDQKASRIEAEALREHKEDKGVDSFLGVAYVPPKNPTAL